MVKMSGDAGVRVLEEEGMHAFKYLREFLTEYGQQ